MSNNSVYIRFPFNDILKNDLSSQELDKIDLERIVFLPNGEPNVFVKNIIKTTFRFKLLRNRFRQNIKSAIIICSKDNDKVLQYSLAKLKQFGIDKNHDILLVDDRSSSDIVLEISDRFDVSYLRVDNSDNIFNYSVLNNLAVCYLKQQNKNIVTFYNNDLWPSNKNTFNNLIDKHNNLNSDLTGCRLVYPTASEYELLGKPKHVLESYIEQAYNTIQHGGIFFYMKKSNFNNDINMCLPSHQWRFFPYDHNIATADIRCCAVTGALHIMNIDKFIDIGGLNQSLSSTFQDIDLCVRLLENNMSVYYIGSEFMYHGESLNLAQDDANKTDQFLSDNILWDYLWHKNIMNLVGFQYNR